MNVTYTSTSLVGSIATTWESIRRRNADVPDVAIAVGAGSSRQRMVLGHFAAGAWIRGDALVAELFIGGEGLERGPLELLTTLLHEAAHGMAEQRGIKDTSRQGRYHNARYRLLAEEVGLSVTHDRGRGWSSSRVLAATGEQYQLELEELSSALVAYRRMDAIAGAPARGSVAAVCQCGRTLRMAFGPFALGPVICGSCGSTFDDRYSSVRLAVSRLAERADEKG